jgi:hypothetical protein
MSRLKILDGKKYLGAGIIIYHNNKYLLQKVKNKNAWEDFGGKTDKKDKNIIETAFRECEEESNNILNRNYLIDLIEKNPDRCYYLLQDNLYFLYMIYISKKEKEFLENQDFGDFETYDNIERKVSWVSKKENFHPRILINNFINKTR